MVSTPTRAEVAVVYNGDPTTNGSGDLSDSDADDLITAAVDMHDNIFSDNILFASEVLNGDQAVKYLAAHKWAIALGDEIQSEGQAGGNVTRVVPTTTERALSRTKYGQEYLEYVRGEPNISVFST